MELTLLDNIAIWILVLGIPIHIFSTILLSFLHVNPIENKVVVRVKNERVETERVDNRDTIFQSHFIEGFDDWYWNIKRRCW